VEARLNFFLAVLGLNTCYAGVLHLSYTPVLFAWVIFQIGSGAFCTEPGFLLLPPVELRLQMYTTMPSLLAEKISHLFV
jgi:hypothetical protein